MLMWAVNIDQPLPNRRKSIQGSRRTIDELAIAPGSRKIAFQNKLMIFTRFQAVLIQESLYRRFELANIKHRLNRALVTPAADQRPISALTQHQSQRADEDRFAGAGLTRDDIVTGLQFQRQVGD